MQILWCHFTLLETSLSKMDYWNIPKESQIHEIKKPCVFSHFPSFWLSVFGVMRCLSLMSEVLY